MFNKKKREIEELKDKVSQMNQEYTNTYNKLLTEQELNKSLSNKLSKCKQCDILQDINKEIANKKELLSSIDNQIKNNNLTINQLKLDIIELKEKQQLQSFGLYDPIYIDKCSDELKDLIKKCRDKQKHLIKNNKFYDCSEEWAVNGNLALGYSMVLNVARTSITSFNLLCDAVIDRVSILNLESTRDKITRLFKKLNKQLSFQKIVLKEEYLNSKLEELDLMYSLAIVKEEEKEKRRIEDERIKEQDIVEKELKKQREKLEKEREKYLIQQSKGTDVQYKIDEIEKAIEDNEFKKEHTLAGYVYIISNPSLGKNIFKVGTTRRLDPMIRISELSNASQPFRFSPNCILFSDNAYELESQLHNEFKKYRVNKVNFHKEYFKLPLQEIEKIVKEKYEPNATFNYDAIDENFLASNWNLGENFLDK